MRKQVKQFLTELTLKSGVGKTILSNPGIALVLLLGLAIGGFTLLGCGGESTAEGTEGLVYEQKNGSYVVTGYNGSSVNIIIPDTYNDVAVTAIADEAFNMSDIQSVVLGKNVTSIGKYAFAGASLLKSVTFKSESINLKCDAFSSCSSLSEVNFSQTNYTITIGEYSFSLDFALTELDLSNANGAESSIDCSSFSGCKNLSTLILPDGISIKDINGNLTYNVRNISDVNGTLLTCDAEIIYK